MWISRITLDKPKYFPKRSRKQSESGLHGIGFLGCDGERIHQHRGRQVSSGLHAVLEGGAQHGLDDVLLSLQQAIAHYAAAAACFAPPTHVFAGVGSPGALADACGESDN